MEEKYTINRKIFSRIGFSLIAFMGSSFIAQIVFQSIIEVVNPMLLKSSSFIWSNIAIMYLIGLPIFYLLIRNLPKFEPAESKKLGILHFLGYFSVSCSFLYIFNMIGVLINLGIGLLTGRAIINPLENILSDTNQVFIIIFVVLLAPPIEEFVFRKLLLDRVRIYGDRFAIIFTAFLFGLFHGNFSQFFYAFALGAVFAYMTIRTNKLRYAIVIHMIINFMGSYLGLKITEIASRIEEVGSLAANYTDLVIVSVFSLSIVLLLVVGIAVFILNIKNIVLKGPKVPATKREINKAAYLNIGMISFIIFSLIQFAFVIIGLSAPK